MYGSQGCRPKPVTRGLICWKYVDHTFNRAHFCMYDDNVLVKPVYVKVCNVLSLMSWLCCVVFRITLIVMLRVSVLHSCGVLLCVINTLSGQCAVLSTCIVIVTYRVL